MVFTFFKVWCIILFASEVFQPLGDLSQIIIQFFLSKSTVLLIVCYEQVPRWRSPFCDLTRSRGSRSRGNSRRGSALAGSADWLMSVDIVFNLRPVNTFVYDIWLSDRLERLSNSLCRCPYPSLVVWGRVWIAVRGFRMAVGVLWDVVLTMVLLVWLFWIIQYILAIRSLLTLAVLFLSRSWLRPAMLLSWTYRCFILLFLSILPESWLPWNCFLFNLLLLLILKFLLSLDCDWVNLVVVSLLYAAIERVTGYLVVGLRTLKPGVTLYWVIMQTQNL